MVTLTGPLLSQTASGKLGDVIQFARYPKRNVAGRRRRPKQPRTRSQLSCRIYMGGIARLWSTLTPAQQATWEKHPEARDTSAYHAYLSENSHRYQRLPNTKNDNDDAHCAPTAVWPATEDTNYSFLRNWELTGLSRAIQLKFDITIHRENWLATIHYAAHEFDYMRYDNISAVILADGTATYEIRIENIPPGEQGLRILPVSHTGFCLYRAYYETCTVLP